MSGRAKPWTEQDDAQLTALWTGNVIQIEIAAAMKRSKGAILTRSKRLKLPPRLLSNLNKSCGFWTAEKDDALKARYAEGWTYTQIAKEIGAASRNACIGRAHRLGLWRHEAANLKNKRACISTAMRASAEAAAKRRVAGIVIRRPRLTVKADRQVFQEAPSRPARVEIPTNVWKPLEGSSPLNFSDPNFNRTVHCSWPVGASVEDRCALPIARGAYCACHAGIAYTPPKPKSSPAELYRSVRRFA